MSKNLEIKVKWYWYIDLPLRAKEYVDRVVTREYDAEEINMDDWVFYVLTHQMHQEKFCVYAIPTDETPVDNDIDLESLPKYLGVDQFEELINTIYQWGKEDVYEESNNK